MTLKLSGLKRAFIISGSKSHEFGSGLADVVPGQGLPRGCSHDVSGGCSHSRARPGMEDLLPRWHTCMAIGKRPLFLSGCW